MTLRPNVEKLLHITQHVFASKTFSKTIGSDSAILLEATESGGVTFSMKILERICQRSAHDPTKFLLPASSTLALFDDLSSYSFMIKDRNSRGGVSVILSTEVLRDVPAGSQVRVHSTISKIGKSIGFSDLFMYNDNNELVARGYHTKYLPMGLVWDFIAHPLIVPLTLNIYNNVYLRFEHTLIGKSIAELVLGGRNRSIHHMPIFEGPESVFNAFHITQIDRPTLSKFVEYNFSVLPFMCNIRGFLHGGCVAMVAEHAARHSATVAQESMGRVSRIDVQYLNAMKGDLSVNCGKREIIHRQNNNLIQEISNLQTQNEWISHASVLKSGKTCATISLSWRI